MAVRALADSVAVLSGSLRLLARARELKLSRAQKMHFSPPAPSPPPPPPFRSPDRIPPPPPPVAAVQLDARNRSPITQSPLVPSIPEQPPPPSTLPPSPVEVVSLVEPPPVPSPPPEIATVVESIIVPPESPAAIQLDAHTEPVEDFPVEIVARQNPRLMKASTVPASRLGRLFHYGGLAAGLSFGAASEAIKRAASGDAPADRGSVFMSESNVRRLVEKLSRMRGAALKLGQFLSIQDSKLLPVQIEQIMMQVQNSANYMPLWQTEKVLASNLGPDWASHFSSFDPIPFAAASIGQVHAAVLSPSSPFAALYPPSVPLAIKVQFPGVRKSIGSDLSNLKWLLVASAVLPRGLFLENTLKVMEKELEDECDYVREAEYGSRMRELLAGDSRFAAPFVVTELCGPMVLVTEMMSGVPLTEAIHYDQVTRDKIGGDVLKLCLRELFHFRLMQTDPNWSNFLFNRTTDQIELIDFGATRAYSQEFIDRFLALLVAAVQEDRDACLSHSRHLGYLIGGEAEEMISAHLASLYALATPFRKSSPSPFPFGTLGAEITSSIRLQIPIMLKYRLSPPPEETYSLNRKLSGSFLLCERLGSRVDAASLLEEVIAEKQRRES